MLLFLDFWILFFRCSLYISWLTFLTQETKNEQQSSCFEFLNTIQERKYSIILTAKPKSGSIYCSKPDLPELWWSWEECSNFHVTFWSSCFLFCMRGRRGRYFVLSVTDPVNQASCSSTYVYINTHRYLLSESTAQGKRKQKQVSK